MFFHRDFPQWCPWRAVSRMRADQRHTQDTERDTDTQVWWIEGRSGVAFCLTLLIIVPSAVTAVDRRYSARNGIAGIDWIGPPPLIVTLSCAVALSGPAARYHSYDHISLLVSFVDVPVSLDNLLERIASIYD